MQSLFAQSQKIQNFRRDFNSKTLSLSRFVFEFTIFFTNSSSVSRISWNHYETTMIHNWWLSLSASRFHYAYTMFSAISLWIHYLVSKFSIKTLSCLRIDFLFREFSINSLPVSRFFFEFTFFFANSLSFPRIYFLFRKFTIYFGNPLWITLWIHFEMHYFLCELTF